MKIVTGIQDMRNTVAAWRQEGSRIGFVPTMGYLHDGHLSLVDAARQKCNRVTVSIYVNPTQFGPNEDLSTYPRDFERDETLCRGHGVDAVFYPSNATMYADDHSTWVNEEALSVPLCGASRPTHFRGVTTVVTKLFNIVQPDVAAFGQKDAQQALIIQRLVRDLNMPVEILVCPIVREADGLAMSSRNRYLDPDARRRACAIHRGLEKAAALFASGTHSGDVLTSAVRNEIENGGGRIDYVELVSRSHLCRLAVVEQPALLAVAAYFGSTRLIDNTFLG